MLSLEIYMFEVVAMLGIIVTHGHISHIWIINLYHAWLLKISRFSPLIQILNAKVMQRRRWGGEGRSKSGSCEKLEQGTAFYTIVP